ncbi:Reverse transcriptase domain [Trinorchestia longiramus]|nr:Reverse transcriptase domain [Trinorchestia longiramus]
MKLYGHQKDVSGRTVNLPPSAILLTNKRDLLRSYNPNDLSLSPTSTTSPLPFQLTPARPGLTKLLFFVGTYVYVITGSKVLRSIRKLHPLPLFFPLLTDDQTREAIKLQHFHRSQSGQPDHTPHPPPRPLRHNLSQQHLQPLPLPCHYPFHLENSHHHHHPQTWQATPTQLFLPSHLTPLSYRQVLERFNQHRPPLRTTIKAIDFSKAFDTVPHPQIISKISSLPLNHHIVRWLVCYLKGRSAKCSYNHHLSSSRPVLAGTPQGSVISSALFNLFISHYPSTAPLITSYNFTALATTVKIPDVSAILFAHSSDVAKTLRR